MKENTGNPAGVQRAKHGTRGSPLGPATQFQALSVYSHPAPTPGPPIKPPSYFWSNKLDSAQRALTDGAPRIHAPRSLPKTAPD